MEPVFRKPKVLIIKKNTTLGGVVGCSNWSISLPPELYIGVVISPAAVNKMRRQLPREMVLEYERHTVGSRIDIPVTRLMTILMMNLPEQ